MAGILIAYVGIFIPYQVCVLPDSIYQAPFYWIQNVIVDLIFVIDLLLNFIKAYDDPVDRALVTNPKKIANRYLR